MKKHIWIKALSIALAVMFSLPLSVGVFAAIDDHDIHNRITEIVQVNVADNDNNTFPDGYDHGYIPVITPVQNADGTYCVCVNENNATLRIYELDKDYGVVNKISIAQQLQEFAAFSKGADGNYYALYAQTLTNDNKGETALRLVQYNSLGQETNALNIAGNVSGSFMGIKEICAGNSALCVTDKYVTGIIGRMMFSNDENGQTHQSSYSFAVKLSNFSQVMVETSVIIPYASHSFHQMIAFDGTDFIFAERGDAFPRAFHLTKMTGSDWTKTAAGDSFDFKGVSGDNDTYSQLGGVVPCGDKYMLVGTYQNSTDSTVQSSANLFVQMFDKTNLNANTEKYLTDYSDVTGKDANVSTVTNPKAVRVSDSKIAVPYMVSNKNLKTEQMHVMFVDNDGNMLSDKIVHSVDNSAVLPRFGSVMYNSSNDSIQWFSIANGKLVINSLEECADIEDCPLYKQITEIVPGSESISVAVSEHIKLSVALKPDGASTFLTWSTADPTIARVDGNGVITGVSAGTTTLTVKAANGVSAAVPVSVVGRTPVQNMSIVFSINAAEAFDAKDVSLKVNDMLYYVVRVQPANATNKDYEVSFSDTSVFLWSKEGDCFKALKDGTCVITFYSVSDPSVRRSFTVKVGTGINITPTTTTTKPSSTNPPSGSTTNPATDPQTTVTVPSVHTDPPSQTTTEPTTQQPQQKTGFARFLDILAHIFLWFLYL